MNVLKLGDAVECIIDHRGKTPKKLGSEFVTSGVPVASALLVRDGQLHLEEARYVDFETYKKWMPEPTRAADVLLTSEGPLGRVARVPDSRPLVLGQRIFGLRGLTGVLDSGYLYYALQTRIVQSQLASLATGTTVLGIRQSALRQLEVPAPTYSEQRAIAEVLGALDDKIVANTRVGQAAIDLAGAYFAATQRADPSTSILGEVVSLEYGKSLPASRRRPGDVTVYGSGGPVGKHDVALAEGPGVVVGRKGSAGMVHWAPEPFYPIDTTFFVVPRADWVSAEYSYFLLSSIALDRMNSDSAVPGLSRSEALQLRIQVPPVTVVERFTERSAPLMARRDQATRENLTLAATRDALLPALMSGKLRVRDAETIVSDLT